MSNIRQFLRDFAPRLKEVLQDAQMKTIPGTEYNNGNTEYGFYPDEEIDPEWLDTEIDKLCAEFEALKKEFEK